MNNQEAYKKMTTFLYKQGQKCVNRIDSSTCVYNGPNSTHCAIGCLLVGIYIDEHENVCDIYKLYDHNNEVAERLKGIDLEFLEQAQNIHDSYKVEEWEDKFKKLSTLWGF